jgi:protein associated with RNAse G/E
VPRSRCTRDDPIGRIVRLHVTKYDGRYHRGFPLRYVAGRDGTHVTMIEPGAQITLTPDPADDANPHTIGFTGEFYLSETRWFHVARMRTDAGYRYGVDIGTPATFDGAQFHFIDLDLDVRWETGGEPVIEDEDEFLDHSRIMRYPTDVIEHARAAVDEVLGLIQARAFPFDRTAREP